MGWAAQQACGKAPCHSVGSASCRAPGAVQAPLASLPRPRLLPPRCLLLPRLLPHLLLPLLLLLLPLLPLLLGLRSLAAAEDANAGLPDRPPNTTLVVLLGNIRGGERAWRSLYRNLLDPSRADLALQVDEADVHGHLGEQHGCDCSGESSAVQPLQAPSLLERAKYTWLTPRFHDWGNALDLIGGDGDWRSCLESEKVHAVFGGVAGMPSSGAILFMKKWFLMRNIVRLDLRSKYKWFVVTRADHFWGCEHDTSQLDTNFIWMPLGEDYNGYTDRHVECNSSTILKVLNMLPPLVLNPHKYCPHLHFLSTNSEQFIKQRFAEDGLNMSVARYPRKQFVVARPQDKSRWGQLTRHPHFTNADLFIKYEAEYDDVMEVCGGIYPFNID